MLRKRLSRKDAQGLKDDILQMYPDLDARYNEFAQKYSEFLKSRDGRAIERRDIAARQRYE